MLSVIVAARNDDYGGGFHDRFAAAAQHNAALLREAGVPFEYVLVEWNPLEDRPLLSAEWTGRLPEARAIVVPREVHEAYSLNPHMPFHEMAAKNVGLRRMRGDRAVVTNADILFGRDVIAAIAGAPASRGTLYRARRIDVRRDTSSDRLGDPAARIRSGEGERPACDYLGAGGDFCLASRELWHALGGFDERTRFTTRAKDWQFFLSARERGVPIQWIGSVYHLEHQGGFRNTPPDERASGRAHFGTAWDFEFGLPFDNGPDWGMAAVPVVSDPALPRVERLELGMWRPASDARATRWIQDAVTGGAPDARRAMLLHTLLRAHAAGAAVHVRPRRPSTAAALAGLAPVAESAGVRVSADWTWPELPGLTVEAFRPLGAMGGAQWIVDETLTAVRVREPRGRPVRVVPRAIAPLQPAFDPMLVRRALGAWLRCQAQGVRRVAIYGAGSHTTALLSLGVPDAVSVDAIVVTGAAEGAVRGIPVRTLDASIARRVDAVLLSSVSFEGDMRDAATAAGAGRVISLYDGWPTWSAGARARGAQSQSREVA